MMTAGPLTTPATGTRSLLSTVPETGRGQASLWTAAAAPDHRLWTTLRGPVGPLQVAHLPPPTTAAACLQEPINHNQSKERRPQDLIPSPSRRAGTGEHRQPPNRWAIPERQSGPYRLVKSNNLHNILQGYYSRPGDVDIWWGPGYPLLLA